eukprot:jgi/Botrbrau1/21566/Bobra.174_2s0064.1
MPHLKAVSVGAASHKGLRSYQEDRYFIAAEFLPEDVKQPAEELVRQSIIAVFDGHGESASAAEYCAKRMPQILSQCSALFGPLEAPEVMDTKMGKLLRDCFKKVDEEVLSKAKMKDGDRSGTTAVIAINIDHVKLF